MAGRYEKYSDFGDTFNPKIWTAVGAGGMGQAAHVAGELSFKAPKLLDLYDTSQNAAGPCVHARPQLADRTVLVLMRQGNNPHLNRKKPRHMDCRPRPYAGQLPGLTISLTYYDIDYEDRILLPGPPSPFDILLQEEQWAMRSSEIRPASRLLKFANTRVVIRSPANA